ncbi:hypothetical protein D3C87_199150 [compost metagenome]
MKNELIHSDALAVLPTLPAASFDALITDPPYASGGVCLMTCLNFGRTTSSISLHMR